MKQLEFKGRGWKSKAPAVDEEKIAGQLKALACVHIAPQAVHVDETKNELLWHRSRILWDSADNKPKALEVYYHLKSYLLPVLAHEVGHLETLKELGGIAYYQSGEWERYSCEYHASRWALEYLARNGVKGARLKKCWELLQGCLDNYGRDVRGRKLVLEVEA